MAYTVWESSVYFADGEIPGPLGSAHRVSAPYQALRTKDGYLNIGAATQPTWEQLCRAIGQDALIDDTRFKLPGDRKAREEELAALLEETFIVETTGYWLNLLEKAGVVAGPIYNMDQVYKDRASGVPAGWCGRRWRRASATARARPPRRRTYGCSTRASPIRSARCTATARVAGEIERWP